MENSKQTGKATCRLSIAAGVLLILGGIALAVWFLGMVPGPHGISVGRFILFEVIALLPVCIGGRWLCVLYRRRRAESRATGIIPGSMFGLLLVAAGLLLYFFNNGTIAHQWQGVVVTWSMLIVLVGISTFWQGNLAVGIIALAAGNFFLIPRIAAAFPGSLDVADNFAAAHWPMLLVAVGVAVILSLVLRGCGCSGSCNCKRSESRKHACSDDLRPTVAADKGNGRVNYNYVFTGSEQVFLEPEFHGGEVKLVFAGLSLDLRRAALPEGVTYLNVNAIFGGVELKVPTHWNVEVRSHCIFGGFKDSRRATVDPSQDGRRLVIIANCVFGGGEIK